MASMIRTFNTSNFSDVWTAASNYRLLDTQLFAWLAVVYTISVVGSIFSVLLLLLLFINKDSRNSSSLLIIHLTLIEFMLTAAQLPFLNTVSFLGTRGWVLCHIDCRFAMFATITCQCMAVWSSLFLSVVRFVASAKPHLYTKLTTR